MKLKRLRAGSYETQDGIYAITHMEFERGYWSVYQLDAQGDCEWLGVEWGLKAAKLYLTVLIGNKEAK